MLCSTCGCICLGSRDIIQYQSSLAEIHDNQNLRHYVCAVSSHPGVKIIPILYYS